jgi:transcription elongation factor GreA
MRRMRRNPIHGGSNMQRIPITPAGHEKMKAELDHLLKVARPENVKAIAEARAHGDLSENAEYHAAKERQSFIEGRIQELQSKISRANVIDPSTIAHDKVAFGATVTLMDLDTDEEKTYTIVGSEEADAKNGFISIDSPVGRALIGKSEGDEVIIKIPAGTCEYEVVSIIFGGA